MFTLGPFGWVAPHMDRGGAGRIERILAGEALTFESSVVRQDGSLVPTEVSARRAETADGPVIVSVIRDTSERAEAEAQMVYLAFHDPLTGLSNRAALERRLADAIADARRYNDILAVSYIDLDRFKPINDSYGHETGDSVLITLGRRLVSGVRVQDLVSRIGGDEFVVVLPRLNGAQELELIAERLLAEIRQPVALRNATCTIDASIGFALFDTANDDARSIIVKADVAMYAAKRDSANPWRIWDESMGMTVAS
jgi:diguanylate cyclase (GGDEF)-like protein